MTDTSTWDTILTNVYKKFPREFAESYGYTFNEQYYINFNKRIVTTPYININYNSANQSELPRRLIYELCCLIDHYRQEVQQLRELLDNEDLSALD